jgi:hypothetical protein
MRLQGIILDKDDLSKAEFVFRDVYELAERVSEVEACLAE